MKSWILFVQVVDHTCCWLRYVFWWFWFFFLLTIQAAIHDAGMDSDGKSSTFLCSGVILNHRYVGVSELCLKDTFDNLRYFEVVLCVKFLLPYFLTFPFSCLISCSIIDDVTQYLFPSSVNLILSAFLLLFPCGQLSFSLWMGCIHSLSSTTSSSWLPSSCLLTMIILNYCRMINHRMMHRLTLHANDLWLLVVIFPITHSDRFVDLRVTTNDPNSQTRQFLVADFERLPGIILLRIAPIMRGSSFARPICLPVGSLATPFSLRQQARDVRFASLAVESMDENLALPLLAPRTSRRRWLPIVSDTRISLPIAECRRRLRNQMSLSRSESDNNTEELLDEDTVCALNSPSFSLTCKVSVRASPSCKASL